MYNVAAIEKRAVEMAAKSTDGTVSHAGETYTLSFNHAHWFYAVTDSEGLFVVNLNVKGLAKAKRELLHWLTH